METSIAEYTKEVEDLFISMMLCDPELYVRCKGILKSTYFEDRQNAKTVDFMNEHYMKFSDLPTYEQIKAVVGKEVDRLSGMHESHKDWFLAEFEQFARHKSLEREILNSAPLLEQKRYGEVEDRIKKAVQVGLVKDLGTDYFENPAERLENLRDNDEMFSTGWRDIDKKLYGGFTRGALNIFAGQSGAGKSIFLQNLALNWVEQGLNVVYLSLELSEKLCSMRFDSMISNYSTNELLKNVDDVSLRVAAFHRAHKGRLCIKQMPNGCTANDVLAYIKEYEIQKNIKVDAVLLDYLDLCMPMSVRVNPSDMFIKDKYVSEELRNLATQLDVLFCTASQLNRASHEEIEFDHQHISGGISKINTADNVIGIFVTPAMKESGRYQVQFMKTRSSSGVGSKVDLKFDVKTLRISDLEEGEESSMSKTTSNIINNLKTGSVIKEPAKSSPTKGNDVLEKSAKLRDILKKGK